MGKEGQETGGARLFCSQALGALRAWHGVVRFLRIITPVEPRSAPFTCTTIIAYRGTSMNVLREHEAPPGRTPGRRECKGGSVGVVKANRFNGTEARNATEGGGGGAGPRRTTMNQDGRTGILTIVCNLDQRQKRLHIEYTL